VALARAGTGGAPGLSEHRPSLSILLPALNEAANVGRVVRECLSAAAPECSAVEVIVVDDGSVDETAAIVASLAAGDPRVRLQRHPHNLGYGAAIRTAIASASCDLVLITDADGQFDLADLPRVLSALGDADCVLGYRRKRRDPLTRVVLGELYRVVIRALFGIAAKDPECAFKLFRRSALSRVPLRSEHGGINVELLLGAQRAGLEIEQVPVTHRPRAGGRSQISPLYALRSIAWVFAYRFRG
jgi:dolichol-phosphate mannosyltransferase